MLLILCAISAVFFQPETGSVIPSEFPGLKGYAPLTEPEATGQEEWTGSGPWGGNLRGLAASESDNSIVIAGCGFSMASDAGGVWRSADGGTTWNVTELAPLQINDVCTGGSADPGKFYASTRTGLYSSTDNGVSWDIVSVGYFLAVGVNSADADLLIGGLSSNTGIRRSTDGGDSWQSVGLNTGFMKGFGCDPEHPDTMYVAMSGMSHALYRSVNGGVSWSAIGPSGSGWGVLVAPFGSAAMIILSTSDGFYRSVDYGQSWDLVVSGASYAPAVCDGVNLYAPVISESGVYESTDQGASWTLNTSGITASFWQAGCASSMGYLAGHSGGIYRTAAPQNNYAVSQEGISNGYIHAVSYAASTGILLAGGDSHGLWKSSDHGDNWEIVSPGPANWTIYDIAPKTEDDYTGEVRYLATAGGVFRSDDAGENWTIAGLSGTSISCIAFDPSDPDIAWAGTSTAGIQYTTNGGDTWTLGTGSAAGFYPSIELIGMPSGEYRILATFQQNSQGVYYSDDGGASYTMTPVSGTYLPDLGVSPHNGGSGPTAFLATDGGVFRSYDYGESWEACPGSSGLLWSVQGSLCNSVFAGTNGSGVRWSPDDGNSWQLLNTGIENRVVWDITQGQDQGQLFAGLRGFGVVELTDPLLGVKIAEQISSTISITVFPNPASSNITFILDGLSEGTGLVSVYSADGRLVHTQNITAFSEQSWSPDAGVSSGIYLVKAVAGNRSGTSRLVLIR